MSSTPPDPEPTVPESTSLEALASDPSEADASSMLAELDALLERMMALPVSHVEQPANDPIRRIETPPADVPLITVTETLPDSGEMPQQAPAIAMVTDDLYFQALLAEHSRAKDAPPAATQPPEPVVFQREPLPAEAGFPSEVAEDAANPAPGPGRWGLSLSWINRTCDRALAPLGSPGRWLRGETARAFLGWTGVVLLLAVAGLAVFDCLDWTW